MAHDAGREGARAHWRPSNAAVWSCSKSSWSRNGRSGFALMSEFVGPACATRDEPSTDAPGVVLRRLAGALGLEVASRASGGTMLAGPGGNDIEPWREEYPYDTRMGRKRYEATKLSLQIELLKMQRWVKASGRRLLIVFEGRDAAGKGGAIRQFTEHLNPRGTRVVACARSPISSRSSSLTASALSSCGSL